VLSTIPTIDMAMSGKTNSASRKNIRARGRYFAIIESAQVVAATMALFLGFAQLSSSEREGGMRESPGPDRVRRRSQDAG
jgi:hypothetical protein